MIHIILTEPIKKFFALNAQLSNLECQGKPSILRICIFEFPYLY